ncbi:MAG: 4Fe-4S dicluster domain-containing protein [Desulfotomaculales bacterium]
MPNCGSCQNFCPVYGVLGDSFGQKYVGGIGLVQTVFTQGTEDALAGGLAACLTCGNCVRACPVQINTPSLILRLRQELAEKKGLAWPKRLAGYFLKDQKRLFRTVRAAVRLAGPLLLEPCALPRGVRLRLAAGAAQRRFLPEPAPVPLFRKRWTKGFFESQSLL